MFIDEYITSLNASLRNCHRQKLFSKFKKILGKISWKNHVLATSFLVLISWRRHFLRGFHHNFSGTVNLCETMLNLDLFSVEIFYKSLIMNWLNWVRNKTFRVNFAKFWNKLHFRTPLIKIFNSVLNIKVKLARFL